MRTPIWLSAAYRLRGDELALFRYGMLAPVVVTFVIACSIRGWLTAIQGSDACCAPRLASTCDSAGATRARLNWPTLRRPVTSPASGIFGGLAIQRREKSVNG